MKITKITIYLKTNMFFTVSFIIGVFDFKISTNEMQLVLLNVMKLMTGFIFENEFIIKFMLHQVLRISVKLYLNSEK